MSEDNHSHIKNLVSTAWNRLKQAVFVVGRFFKTCANSAAQGMQRCVALILKKEPKEKRGSADNTQTQLFDSVGAKKPPSSLRSQKSGSSQTPIRELPHISKEHLSGEGKEHINMFSAAQRRPNFVIGIVLTSFKLLLIAIFMIGAAGVGTLVGVAKGYMETTPTLDTGRIQDQSETSYIYDCNDELITTYTGLENRDWATYDEIPQQLREAVIAIEDVRFEYHTGVDIKRLVGAFINNMMNDAVQGGSTLTQQIIKNRLLSTERTYKRKIQEAYLALQLEQEYEKKEILETYMNTIPLGSSNYGVKAAALDYFDKELDELTLRECAMIAGITRYPYAYNPRRAYYELEDASRVNDRTDEVLHQMYKAGYITLEEKTAALNDTVSTVVENSTVHEMYKMAYFVEYAVYDVITHMLKQRNMQDTTQNRAIIENEIRTNGYSIYTTVDPDIQNIVQTSLSEWDGYPELADDNDAVMHYANGESVIQPQAAAVVVEQSSGQLKAVVGGRDEPEAKKTLHRAYQASMPVGSSIKPIAVYAPAIDKGAGGGTIIPHIPVALDDWDDDGGKGYPTGGTKYYGPVSLREALVKSLNRATAYTLFEHVGIQDSKNQYLVHMGINPSHIYENGAGLALGTSPITPIEMAGAFATIANSGEYLEPLSFRTVKDNDGNIILDADEIREQTTRQVFKKSTAWLVTDMLQEAVQSGTGTEARISGMNVGGKTGTNQDARGLFFAGISPYYTATVWIGHDGFQPLANRVYAGDYTAPLWKDFMSKIFEKKELENKDIIEEDPEDLGLIQRRVCTVTGMLATDACEKDTKNPPDTFWFLSGTEPTEKCTAHQLVDVCEACGKIATPYCPVDQVLQDQSLLFLPSESEYWKLSQEKREQYLGVVYPALENQTLESLTIDMPEYYTYYCNIHTQEWHTKNEQKQSAITAANAQIVTSQGVLANSAYSMSLGDQQLLTNKINELDVLVAAVETTTGALEQKTAELKTLTDQLVALYSQPTPTPTPPTPTPTPPTPTPTPPASTTTPTP